MPPISGSQMALMQARAGIARCGATRVGYFDPVNAILSINSVTRRPRLGTLRVALRINDEVDTAAFTIITGPFYREVVLLSDPSSYWRLNESSGNAADSAGSVTATANGTPAYSQTGPLSDGSTAIALDGSVDYFTAGDVYDFTGLAPFTVEFWINLTANHATQFVRILSKEVTDGGGAQGWTIGVDPVSAGSPRVIFFDRKQNGSTTGKRSTTQLTIGAWTHVVCTYDGATQRIYINGVENGAGVASSLSIVNHGTALHIGRRSDSSTAFLNGVLSDIAIYSSEAIPVAEIEEHYRRRTTLLGPSVGQTVIVALGDIANREFAGQIMTTDDVRRQGFTSHFHNVTCSDWSKQFDRRLITQTWTNTSASTIAAAILGYASGFTGVIASGLATIDSFVATNEAGTKLLRRLANLIGGGFFIEHHVLHFFGAGGAPNLTSPTTLANSIGTLERHTFMYDRTQIRTRVIAEGRQTKTLIEVPAGSNTFPIEYGWAFASSGYARIGANVFSYSTRFAVNGIVGPPAAQLTAAAAVGAASVTIVTNADLLASYGDGTVFWLHDEDMNFFAGMVLTSFTTDLYFPFTSGFGSVQFALANGSAVYGTDSFDGIFDVRTGLSQVPKLIEAGESVVVHVIEDDAAAQAVIAGIEGGDGIYEHFISNSDWHAGQAEEAAIAELDLFAAALIEQELVTRDLNGKVGRAVSANFDGVVGPHVITQVDLSFPVKNKPPRRLVRASSVRVAMLGEAVQVQEY